MIQEDYVNFETAKLLKEKGFDIPICNCYLELDKGGYIDIEMSDECHQNERYDSEDSSWKFGTILLRPTHQMALKWLRENNFHIILDIEVDYDEDERGMKWYHKSAWYWTVYRIDDREQMSDNGDLYSTYEEACEAAIKYCLENLI